MKEVIIGFDKTENFFPNNIDYNLELFDKEYKKNINVKWDFYNEIKILPQMNIGKFENSNISYLIYSILKQDDYKQFVYEEWIKSIENNTAIDSLQLVYYTSYDGIKQRMASTILSPEKIQIEHYRLEWDIEKDNPNDLSKIKTIKGIFLINNGHFVYQNSVRKPTFFDGYSWGDLYSNIDRNCWVVENTQELDINNDGIKDAIFFLKNKGSKQCSEEGKYDLLISIADKHGLYTFETAESLDIKSDKIKITKYEHGLKIIIDDKNTDKLEFYFQYHNFINVHLKNKLSLEKIEKEGKIMKTNNENEYISIRNIISVYLK